MGGVDVVHEGAAVEGLGGGFEGGDEAFVEADAARECFVFGNDFALAGNRRNRQTDVAHCLPIKNFTSAPVRMVARIAVKFRAAKPHHQICGKEQIFIRNFKNRISLRNNRGNVI